MTTWMKRGMVAVAALAVLLGGLCAGISAMDHPLPVSAHAPDPGERWPAAQPPVGLAFSVLQTSSSKGAFEALIVGGGSWLRYRHPAQVAVLVTHPRGSFLFDTGLGRQVAQQFAVNTWLDRQFFAFGPVHPVADQLAQAGWPADRIRMIVPSHMHWDHVSALADFPQAEVWVTPTELSHARQGHAPGFLRSQFDGVRHWHELRFTQGAQGAYLSYTASLDLFGDGSVVLVPLSGHTAGQVGMFLNLPSGQHYFFTGDVSWTIEGLRRPADRSWALRQVLHPDHDEQDNQSSIVHIHQIMQRYPALRVVPAHDENVLQTLPHFPQFQG